MAAITYVTFSHHQSAISNNFDCVIWLPCCWVHCFGFLGQDNLFVALCAGLSLAWSCFSHVWCYVLDFWLDCFWFWFVSGKGLLHGVQMSLSGGEKASWEAKICQNCNCLLSQLVNKTSSLSGEPLLSWYNVMFTCFSGSFPSWMFALMKTSIGTTFVLSCFSFDFKLWSMDMWKGDRLQGHCTWSKEKPCFRDNFKMYKNMKKLNRLQILGLPLWTLDSNEVTSPRHWTCSTKTVAGKRNAWHGIVLASATQNLCLKTMIKQGGFNCLMAHLCLLMLFVQGWVGPHKCFS